MKISKSRLKEIIKEELDNTMNEAHGLSKKDVDHLEKSIEDLEDKELKRILRFLVKSNIEVDKTKDLSKEKKK
jgi:glutamyl-tRNA reductase